MKIITTEDGSHTLFTEQFQDVNHSQHGALRESNYVFIKQGLEFQLTQSKKDNLKLFEVGFGTGLNALLTMLAAEKKTLQINYTTIELYPVPIETIKALNYTDLLGYEFCYGPYHTLHLSRWNEPHEIKKHFTFAKIQDSFLSYEFPHYSFDLIYFDAFSPISQPELWTVDVMKKMFTILKSQGILVSYSSKSTFQKALKEAGFRIEKLAGPPGKREMVRAHKD